jgi:hypothetical protein
MCRSGILSLISVLAIAGLVRGECREEKDLRDDPLLSVVDGRELAQARATLGGIKDLARAKLVDARGTAAGRFKEFIAGRGTLEFVIESRYRLLDSELALAVNDRDRVAACERFCEVAQFVEQINKARWEAGRIAIQDYMSSTTFCRDAEIRLIRSRQNKMGAELPLVGPRLEQEDYWLSEIDNRELAQAKLRAINTPIETLLKAKRDAARVDVSHRFQDFCAGRGTLDFLLRSVLKFLDAERAIAGDTPASQAAYYEAYWLCAREMDRIDTARYQAGRIPIQDWMQSRYFLLDAKIGLLQTPAKEEKGAHRALIVLGIHDELIRDDLDFFKEVSKERQAVRSANLSELLHQRKAAARREYVARAKEFLGGRGTLDFLHEVTLHLRDSELAIAKQDTERRAILERNWARCKSIEAVNKYTNDQGRIPTKEYLESRWYRLDAEIDLVRALAKK